LDRKELLQGVRLNCIKIAPRKRVVSVNPGEWTSPFEGKGFETRGFRDYQLGDDPRAVHLSTSVRRGTKTIVERVALRDLTVVIMLDLSPSMMVREKPEMQLIAAALLMYSAWKAETTFSLAIYDGEHVNSFGRSVGTRHFYKLYSALWDIYSSYGKTRSGIGRPVHMRHAFPQNSILFYCSDYLSEQGDITETIQLWKQVYRYDLIPVVIQDEFEYTFPIISSGTFVLMNNPETGWQEEMWISKDDCEEMRAINEQRLRLLTEFFNSKGIGTIHVDNTDLNKLRMSVLRFFEQRKRGGAK